MANEAEIPLSDTSHENRLLKRTSGDWSGHYLEAERRCFGSIRKAFSLIKDAGRANIQ